MEEIKSYNINLIPKNLIEDFGQNLLMTKELLDQINKLILKHFE